MFASSPRLNSSFLPFCSSSVRLSVRSYLYPPPTGPPYYIHRAPKMSLKRKASFIALPSSPSAPAPSEWGMVIDGSPHLHSRTRKRFRDDRPSDQVIYRKCFPGVLSLDRVVQSLTTGRKHTTVDLLCPKAARVYTGHRYGYNGLRANSRNTRSP